MRQFFFGDIVRANCLTIFHLIGVTTAIISLPLSSEAVAQSNSLPASEYSTTAYYSSGIYRYSNGGQWTDTARDKSYRYHLIETGRDQNAVYLRDNSRNLAVQLNFRRFMIATAVEGSALVDYVKITSFSGPTNKPRRPYPPAQFNAPIPPSAVNGSNLSAAYFSGGSYRQIAPGRWHEFTNVGAFKTELTEINRGRLSVTLQDTARSRRVRLNLANGRLGSSTNGRPIQETSKITRTETNGPTTGQPSIQPAVRPPYAAQPYPIAQPAPRALQPRQTNRDVNAGPIYNQQDATVKCTAVAYAVAGTWTGQWRVNGQTGLGVCQIAGAQ